MIDIGSPLAAIYSTSTMEHHHFNMAINILQQVERANIIIMKIFRILDNNRKFQ